MYLVNPVPFMKCNVVVLDTIGGCGMASPFPGMDPYIEDPEIWSDFHSNLATEIQGQLNPIIGPGYVARLMPRVTYEIVEVARTQVIRPDVGVWQNPPSRLGRAATTVVIPPAPVTSTPRLKSSRRSINSPATTPIMTTNANARSCCALRRTCWRSIFCGVANGHR